MYTTKALAVAKYHSLNCGLEVWPQVRKPGEPLVATCIYIYIYMYVYVYVYIFNYVIYNDI